MELALTILFGLGALTIFGLLGYGWFLFCRSSPGFALFWSLMMLLGGSE
jgi:hypothetical protein